MKKPPLPIWMVPVLVLAIGGPYLLIFWIGVQFHASYAFPLTILCAAMVTATNAAVLFRWVGRRWDFP